VQPETFQLMAELIELYCKDRDAGKRGNNYRTMTASELANLLESDNEEAVRQTVSRIRSSLTQGCGAPVLPSNGLHQLKGVGAVMAGRTDNAHKDPSA